MLCLQHIVILFVILKLKTSTAKSISYGNCDMKQPSRGILDLKLEQNPAKLLNATTAYSLKDCSKDCCNKPNCNAYIWRNSEQCFLFHCKVLQDCKVVPYQGTITGFVSRSVALRNASENSSEKSHKSVIMEMKTIPNQLPRNNNKAKQLQKETLSGVDEEKLKVSDEEQSSYWQESSKRTLQGKNLTTTKNSSSKSTIATKLSLRRAKAGSTKNATASVIPVLNSSLSSQKITHTTTTSLIAALSFGLVFLVAVVVLIGKPWWQSFFGERDGYSRVTFLMNGK